MDINLQGKLLRFLEDRIIRKIGGRKEIEADVILLSSTNKDLHVAVAEGRFRADLFHRINLVNIHLPPLRERKEDIPVLTEYFLNKYRRKHGKEVKGFTDDAMNILTDYYWPGNVRELRNFIEQILIFEDNIEAISPETIVRNLQLIQPQTTGIDPFLIDQLLFRRDFTYNNIVRDFSKKLLKRALELSNNNRVKAARLLKIDRSTLNYQIRILGIEP
jgi:transcriptional regulator with PAS, ATPase and Fis domain